MLYRARLLGTSSTLVFGPGAKLFDKKSLCWLEARVVFTYWIACWNLSFSLFIFRSRSSWSSCTVPPIDGRTRGCLYIHTTSPYGETLSSALIALLSFKIDSSARRRLTTTRRKKIDEKGENKNPNNNNNKKRRPMRKQITDQDDDDDRWLEKETRENQITIAPMSNNRREKRDSLDEGEQKWENKR